MKKAISYVVAVLLVSVFSVLSFAETVPEEDKRPNVIDSADILSASVENQLESIYDNWKVQYETDVVFLSVNSIGNNNIDDYAADYYDYLGYGIGGDNSGIILCICMDPADRCFTIITTGKEINRYYQSDIEKIYDSIEKNIKENDFDCAAIAFTGMVSSKITDGDFYGAKNFVESQFGKTAAKTVKFTVKKTVAVYYLAALVVGIAAGLITAFVLKGQTTPVKRAVNARNYLVRDSFNLRNQTVMYLRSDISRRAKPDDEGGSLLSHGSGGGHSGVSHGSGGGHSGVSHGGGGGRHF